MAKTMNISILAATSVLLGAQAAGAIPKRNETPPKGPVDQVVEKYEKARAPVKGQPAVPMSPGDCKGFAKDFIRAGEKEKDREADGYFNAGVVYDNCGMKKEAEEQYRAALAKNPRFAPAMNNLGVLYWHAGQISAATQQFEAAIKVDPKSAQAVHAYNNRGAMLFEQARRSGSASPAAYQEAIGSLQRALAVDASSVQSYQLLAMIYFHTAEQDRSKLRLAQLVCDEAKKINDDYAPIYNTLGLIKLRSKDVTGALAEFRKAVQLDPGLIEAQLNIGAISLSARTYKQAEEAFQAVLKKQPNNIDAVIGMGVAMRGQKRIDEAEAWYRKVAQLDPKNCAIFYNLGLLYQDYKGGSEEELRKAQQEYNKYISCPGGNDPDKIADARRRIKDIDDTFKAMAEQRALEAELKKQQEEMERQQKAMEEQMKKQGQAPQGDQQAPPK